MGLVRASLKVPGLASEAEALWYDPVRWAAWVDGFGHVAELSKEWPAEGRLVWDSLPGGRGRVMEIVRSYEPRTGQTLAVEDERLLGTQKVTFVPGPDEVTIELELDYELKGGNLLTPIVDALVVRRELEGSLRRTLERFARERRAEGEWDALASR
jgi:uncharacterized membrane protein